MVLAQKRPWFKFMFMKMNEILEQELIKRKKANSQYSLRSFSKYLEVSPATLSQIMSGKRPLSLKMGQHFFSKLGLSAHEQSSVLDEYKVENENLKRMNTHVLPEDHFKLISEWQYYAILSLGKLPQNRAEPLWIARRLGISLDLAKDSFERLLRMRLIEINEGHFRQTTIALQTSEDIPSSAIRRFHRQMLHLAEEKMESVSTEHREYSGATLAVAKNNLPRAKAMIRAFIKEFDQILEKGPCDEVYHLSVYLFPLTNFFTDPKQPEENVELDI